MLFHQYNTSKWNPLDAGWYRDRLPGGRGSLSDESTCRPTQRVGPRLHGVEPRRVSGDLDFGTRRTSDPGRQLRLRRAARGSGRDQISRRRSK